MKLISKSNFSSLGGNLVASALGLAVFLILARIMNPTVFGYITIFYAMAGLGDLVRTGFVRQGLVREYNVAASDSERKSIIASAWILHTAIALGIILFIWLLKIIIVKLFSFTLDGSWSYFFNYYPILLIVSMPHQMEAWVANAKGSFLRMNSNRALVNFIIIVLVLLLKDEQQNAEYVIYVMILANLAVSVPSLARFPLHDIFSRIGRVYVAKLYHYGKYSMTTLAGVNLLKSTDILIIGAFIGPVAAAEFAIPLKLIEVVEIPLRSFLVTSFSSFSKYYQAGLRQKFRETFIQQVGMLTTLVFPLSLCLLFIPKYIMYLLGGEQYSGGVSVLMVLSITLLVLPLDKFAGVALDSINRPDINALKVWGMVLINILGDLIVVAIYPELWAIAMVTLLNITSGIAFALWKNSFMRRIDILKSELAAN